ncbi:MFS transporter [Brachybacterium sp. AOP25-B2-12]|uniref:MFS transporter n=1 Tax=Brachybacterium sp. AOP25-B2-12 TaxID=3457710 RepID=UPI0040347B8F
MPHDPASSAPPVARLVAPDRHDAPSSLLAAMGLGYFPVALIARFPFAMVVVGTLTLVVGARGSISLGGLVSAVVGIGSAIGGPVLGAAADRFGQRGVLLVAGTVNALSLLALTAVAYSAAPDAALLAVGLVLGASAPQVGPMSRSRLVQVIVRALPLPRRHRTTARTMAYESAADETTFVFGPVLVGLLATTLNPAAPLIGAAVLTLVFVTSFALHRTARAVVPDPGAPALRAPAGELGARGIVVVVAGALGVGIFFGGVLTSLTAAMRELGRGEAAGLVYAVMGVGSAVLALASALLPDRFGIGLRWIVFAGVMTASMLGYAMAGSLTGVTVALAVAGPGIGPTVVALYSLAAERSPVGRSATVMTMLGSATAVGQALASAATGRVAEDLGVAAAAWIPLGASVLLLALGVLNRLLVPVAPTVPPGPGAGAAPRGEPRES